MNAGLSFREVFKQVFKLRLIPWLHSLKAFFLNSGYLRMVLPFIFLNFSFFAISLLAIAPVFCWYFASCFFTLDKIQTSD
jgi:hypothetical protein